MKSISHFTFFFLILFSNSYGQGPFMEFDSAINQYDSLHRKIGPWTEYDSVRSMVTVRKDRVIIFMTDTGCVRISDPTKIDTVDISYRKIFQRYGLFVEGKKHGPWIGFHDHGPIKYIITYDHGVPFGKAFHYGLDGEIYATAIFNKDNPEKSIFIIKNDEGEMTRRESSTDFILIFLFD